MKVDIKRIRALSLKPDEYLFVGVSEDATKEEVENLHEALMQWLGNRVMVHCGPLKLNKVKISKRS